MNEIKSVKQFEEEYFPDMVEEKRMQDVKYRAKKMADRTILKAKIVAYLQDHPDAKTDELHREMGVDIDELLKVFKELEEEGKIRGEPA